ncbi:nitroreductase family protein [Agromyces sp. NPDC049794]|uniref:nitroreductase family protein n=1 Tax=unclassified Agromyces TaxID=2639701 RepID=UPI0033FD3089
MPHAFTLDRYSPVRFDAGHSLSSGEVDLLLESARRAPSAGNSQPWSFVVGRRGDRVHQRLRRHLARSAARWAPDASVLVANLAHRFVEDSDMEYSEFAHYDLGQAVAHMTFQAHTMGLFVHQFRAFDRDGVSHEFQIPAHWEVTSMAAIGMPVEGSRDMQGAGTGDERFPLQDITWERAG